MNVSNIKLEKNISRPDILFGVARVPGTGRAFVGGSDFKIHEIDIDAAKPDVRTLKSAHETYITTLALAGDTIISGGYDGKLVWTNSATGEKTRETLAHARAVRKIALSPDAKTAVSVADDMAIRFWNIADGKKIREITGEHQPLTPQGFRSMLYACAFSADGKHLATADKTGHVVIWEAATGRKVASLEVPVMYTWDPNARRHSIGGPRSVAFSPDGQLLAIGGTGKIGNIDHLEADGRVEIFRWAKGEKLHDFITEGKKGLVEHLEFHPGGEILLAAGGAGEGFLSFIDLKQKKIVHQEKSPMNIHAIATADGMKSIVAVGHQRVARFTVG
jgi:WD40 repeat protein